MKSGADSSKTRGTDASIRNELTAGRDTARPPGAPPPSAHALQLQRGFPRLKFAAPLEAEFREVHLAETLPQIRRNLWLAIVFVVAFSALTHLVLDEPVNQLLDLIRVAMF